MTGTTVTLVINDEIDTQLQELVDDPLERAAVLLVGVARQGPHLRLLARRLLASPADSYVCRGPRGLELTSAGWAPALAVAAETGSAALFVHTHPGGVPTPSSHDSVVDELLEQAFRIRTGQSLYGSLVIAPDLPDGPDAQASGGWTFTGRVVLDDVGELPVRRLVQLGRRLVVTASYDEPTPEATPQLFSRQIQAFGGDVQRVLGQLRVGVAGAGGTGSAVLEQLVRLGVRHLVLADPDVLSDSNVTRVYGSTPADIGRPKVDIQRDHLIAIAPDLELLALHAKTTTPEVVRALSSCDVVFGCTDDDAGRIILSRLASYYAVLLIDCGIQLSSTGGALLGIDARVTTIVPGAACLMCRGRVDPQRAAAELLDEQELRDRQREGYAPELAGVEPAVVSYTSITGALAVSELLERLTGYGRTPAPNEVIARLHERELSTNSRSPKTGHFCQPDSPALGSGDRPNLLDWTWRTS